MAKFLQKYLCQKYGISSLKFHIAKASSEIEFINLKLVIKKTSCSNNIGPIFTANWTYIYIYGRLPVKIGPMVKNTV